MEEVELFVPGRLCIFGEHSDWASEYRKINQNIEKGYAIVATINQGIYATCKKSDKIIFSMDKRYIKSKLIEEELNKCMDHDKFYSCVICTAKYMLKNYDVEGLQININHMDLPIGVGLSSSSAICVLVVKGYNELYNLKLQDYEIMEIAYKTEREAGFKCGRMDHICGLNKKILEMQFDQTVTIKDIEIKDNLYFVFGVVKKKQTKKILEELNEFYPYIQSDQSKSVHECFGIDNKNIIEKALDSIEQGNIFALGKLMNDAQKIYEEKISSNLSNELRDNQIYSMINNPEIQELILGAKGVGSHGDGAVQFLVKQQEDQKQLVKKINQLGYRAYSLSINKE